MPISSVKSSILLLNLSISFDSIIGYVKAATPHGISETESPTVLLTSQRAINFGNYEAYRLKMILLRVLGLCEALPTRSTFTIPLEFFPLSFFVAS